MLLLEKNKGQGTNKCSCYIIPLCNPLKVVVTLFVRNRTLVSNIRNLIIFCINVDIHEMLLLQKNKGQRINIVIVILHCNSLNFLSVSLVFPAYLD